MWPSSSARRPDWIPWPTAPCLTSVRTSTCTMIHPSSLSSGHPRRPVVMVLQVTILPAHTAVTHGSRAGDHTGKGLPERGKGVWGGKEEQNLCKAPAGTESDPSCYYHIIWRACMRGTLAPVGWVELESMTIVLPSRGVGWFGEY